MSSGKEIHEIGRSLSSDRRRSFSPDKARERSIQDAHGQLEQLRPELKLLLSASEWSGTSEATSLEGKLDQLANKYQDDTAFGTDHENLPARLKKLATAFREHRGSRTSGNLRNLLEAWQSVTQEDNRVSSLSEIPSIEPMTLEEKIAKLRESKKDLQSLAKPLRRFTDTISAKCQLGKLKDPSQLENVIDSRLGQLQDKGASSSSIDETGTSTNRRKQLTHETQKFDLGEAFSGYSGVTLLTIRTSDQPVSFFSVEKKIV